MEDKGFTLVELLVVISMVTLVSGGVYAYSASARERAFDAVQLAETAEVRKALEVFHIQNNHYPTNYGSTVAQEGSNEYNQSMQELVDADLLENIPESPRGDAYHYYNFSDDGSVSPYTASAQYNKNAVNADKSLIYMGTSIPVLKEEGVMISPLCVPVVQFEQCDAENEGPYPDWGCYEEHTVELGYNFYEFFDDQYGEWSSGEDIDYCPYPISL